MRKKLATMRGSRSVTCERLEGRRLMAATPVAAPAGSARLTGAVLGTAGSYRNGGATAANAVDGNPATYFDAAAANGDWAGLDLGAAKVLTQVQFLPRAGWGGRMVGGVFQGSTTADFSAGVVTLSTVTTVPATATYTAVPVAGQFEFVRYLAPAGAYGNVAEIEFDGVVATAPPTTPTGLTATAPSGVVHLSWSPDATGATSGFTVERQGPSDANFVVIGTTANATFDDATATANTAYAYCLVATNSFGASPLSAAVTVTTPPPFVNPWTDADIGAVGKAGAATATAAGVTVTGGGADIWNSNDAFNFNYQPLVGNGTVTVQVASQGNTNGWAKSGIMVRESLRDDSRFVLLALTPGNGVTWQVRSATHATPSSTTTAGKAGVWLQVTRTGGTFTGSVSTDGVTWKPVGTATVPMVNNVCAGLAVTAHDNGKASTSTFASASVTAAAAAAASVWTAAATAPLSRWESQTFSYGGTLYVFGGFVDRNLNATAECDAYDPATNAWSYVTTVPTGALTHAATTVVGDTAYFAGGDLGQFLYVKGNTSTAAVLTYNLTTGAWGSVASLPAAQSCGGLVCINNSLYYYGGLNATNKADLSTTWSLDLGNSAASWVAQAAMPNGRNHLGAVAINGIAYAVGGAHLYNMTKGNDAEVDAYDPVANAWTKVASLPMAWSSNETTTMVVNGKIVIVGGQTNGGYDGIYLSQIEAYDPVANAWAQVGTLPEANEGESVAYVNGQLIVAQGTVDNLGGWSQNQVWVTSAIAI